MVFKAQVEHYVIGLNLKKDATNGPINADLLDYHFDNISYSN